MTQTPWAILLCNWQDHEGVEPYPRQFFEELFTRVGAGTGNMVDFFNSCSHGNVDVSGSEVFGWFTLPKSSWDYSGNAPAGPGQINRQGLINLARLVASDKGAPLSRFFGVVVVMGTLTDLFGGGGRHALCDPGSLQPAVLGQEMGHGYGMSHSRRNGSTTDYTDAWDTMSTWNSCHMAEHAAYTLIGPGLNAANMRGRGWLDESRVWRGAGGNVQMDVTLRPLHRRDLPGLLAAELAGPGGPFLIEFRNQDGWDAAIPRPAVLVHRFMANQSYLMPAVSGTDDLGDGDVVSIGIDVQFADYASVEVVAIDKFEQTATVRLYSRRAQRPELAREGGLLLGGVAVDGGGYIVIGRQVIPVPPWEPMAQILKHVAAHQASILLNDDHTQVQVRTSELEAIKNVVERLLDATETFHTPAPLVDTKKK